MYKVVRLVRHAESAANSGLVTTAPDTIPMIDHGRTQAILVAQTMPVVPRIDCFVAIRASDGYCSAQSESLRPYACGDLGS